jgi:hypothetical protein
MKSDAVAVPVGVADGYSGHSERGADVRVSLDAWRSVPSEETYFGSRERFFLTPATYLGSPTCLSQLRYTAYRGVRGQHVCLAPTNIDFSTWITCTDGQWCEGIVFLCEDRAPDRPPYRTKREFLLGVCHGIISLKRKINLNVKPKTIKRTTLSLPSVQGSPPACGVSRGFARQMPLQDLATSCNPAQAQPGACSTYSFAAPQASMDPQA